jgi:GNAT superfamily N-acetyltransferase
MTTADVDAGMRLSRAANWNQLADDWHFFVEPPSRAWLLERDGIVIGTSALARYDNLAWVAMMLVDPAERRAGYGTSLLTAALAAADCVPCVGLDATPAGLPLYRKFGFVETYTLVRLIHPTGSQTHASKARPTTPADLASILALDREVFGADRSRLLQSLLSRAPETAWTLEGRGYCFGRPGNRCHQIGPIVATDLDAARELVSSALTHPSILDVPLHDAAWIAWLKSLGFQEERPLTRMFLRGHSHPGDPLRQYAIAGPEYA